MSVPHSSPDPVASYRMTHDLSSTNPLLHLRKFPPFPSNCLGVKKSASAARAQSPGVDRILPGAGRLTLTNV